MRATKRVQLDAVLQQAQEDVRLRERRTVLATDVPALDQGIQRRQRVAAAQRLVGSAVHELQELDGELHVAQSTAS